MKHPVAWSVLVFSLLAAPSSAAVHHYVFGLAPETSYDVRQGTETIETDLIPGLANELVFTAPAASPIYIFPTGELGDVTPPANVSTLTVNTTMETTATLRWTAVGDDGQNGQASTYDIRYSTSPITGSNWGGATQVTGEPTPKVAGQLETFTVTGLNPGTLYYFGMKVADEGPNWSGLSNIASGTTALPGDGTPPAGVTDLSIASTTPTSVRLAWTAVGDDGQSGRATTYDLRYATWPIDGSNWTSATPVSGEPSPKTAGLAESFTVTGLAPATRYYFALKVADEVPNWSALSNVTSAVTPSGDTTPPSTVNTLSFTSATQQSVTISWFAVGDDGTTGQATSYDLRYAGTPITGTSWASATQVEGEPVPKPAGQAETFTITGLSAGTLYYFALKVADEVPNSSGVSNSPSGRTQRAPDAWSPARVHDLQATLPTTNSVTLVWTATGDDSTAGRAAAYDIRLSTVEITEETWPTATQATEEPTPDVSGAGETFVVSGLLPGTQYFFALDVLDDDGNRSGLSNLGSAMTARPADETPPLPVTDLSAASIAHRQIGLAWTAPADDDGDPVASYEGRMSEGPLDETTWEAATPIPNPPAPGPPGGAQALTVIDLAPATSYAFALRARDAEGNLAPLGPVLRVATTSAPDTMAPHRILDLAAINPTQSSVTLRWHAPADSIPADCIDAPEVDRYEIRFALVPLDGDAWDAGHAITPPDPEAPGTLQQAVVTGLASDTRYYFAMRARDARGQWSETSNVAEQATQPQDGLPDAIAPGEIRDLALVSARPTTALIRWIAPGGDGQEGTADHYDVRRSNGQITAGKWDDAVPVLPIKPCAVVGTEETLQVEGLDPETESYFALRAIDAAGNAGPISVSLLVVTPAFPDTVAPAQVTDLANAGADTTSVTLRWTAPADDRGRCAAYDLRVSAERIDEANWDQASAIDGLPSPAAPGEAESTRVTGLQPGTRLAFAVRARDAVGNLSAVSNVVWAETDTIPEPPTDQAPPAGLEDLAAAALSPTSIRLSWTSVGDDGAQGRAMSYEVRRSSVAIDVAGWDAATVVDVPFAPGPAGTAESLTVTGLAPDADHHFAARARDEAGNLSPISVDAWAHTPPQDDTSPPSILSRPIAAGVEDRIELAWDASIDPDVVDYVLYRREVGSGDRIEMVGLRATSYVDRSVEPDLIYAYAVAARDAAGNLSTPSPEAQASVALEAFLPVVTEMVISTAAFDSALASGARILRLRWSASSVDRFSGFAVERSDDRGVTWSPRTTELLDGTGPFLFEEALPPGEYFYRIVAVSPRGYERRFDPIPVSWSLNPIVPSPTAIGEPFPNPSGGRFELPLTLARSGSVRVAVYDLSGRILRVLHQGDEDAGPHSYAWDGPAAASGIYLLRVETEERAYTRKITVRK
jgi:chitodextrinase